MSDVVLKRFEHSDEVRMFERGKFEFITILFVMASRTPEACSKPPTLRSASPYSLIF
ncbi:MAG: hypothetical protein GIW97_03740 [Candidatus Eremiobacteraeota bacterium]|nr:hypothetical protein [Candidatus Eremiobacteraeota bacterium]